MRLIRLFFYADSRKIVNWEHLSKIIGILDEMIGTGKIIGIQEKIFGNQEKIIGLHEKIIGIHEKIIEIQQK